MIERVARRVPRSLKVYALCKRVVGYSNLVRAVTSDVGGLAVLPLVVALRPGVGSVAYHPRRNR